MDNGKRIITIPHDEEDGQVNTIVASGVPSDYVEVRLIGSKGRLTAPPVLHVRDYSFDDALKLAQATEKNVDEILIDVLNGMIFEDFDCGLLHREEVKEILLTVYATWWGKSLDIYYYAVDETLPMGDKENRSIASIPISAIDIVGISDEFQEPILIRSPDGKKSMSFILPRLVNGVIADREVAKAFDAEEASLLDIKWIMGQNEGRGADQQLSYDPVEALRYRSFLTRKVSHRMRVLQALQIYAVDGEPLKSIEEKVEALSRSMTFFTVYKNHLKKSVFGVQPVVEFTCSVKHELISRRFPFRCVDLIPTMEQVGDSGYSISYGGEIPLV
jgi:hypothetical protein